MFWLCKTSNLTIKEPTHLLLLIDSSRACVATRNQTAKQKTQQLNSDERWRPCPIQPHKNSPQITTFDKRLLLLTAVCTDTENSKSSATIIES